MDNWKDKLRKIKESLIPPKKENKHSSSSVFKIPEKALDIIKKTNISQSKNKIIVQDKKGETKSLAGQAKSIHDTSFLKPTIPTSSLPKEVSRGKNKITIGLDFGTSFTKICVRKALGGDDVPIYPIKHSDGPELDHYLWPSRVSLSNDKVYFNHTANSGIVLPHLKVCVACEVGHLQMTDCIFKDTCIFQGTNDFEASDLATLFLAWIMKEARKKLPHELKDSPDFIYNLSVPLKQLDNKSLHTCYKRIAFDAWRISEGMEQGISLGSALKWIKELNKEDVPLPEKSPVQLCVETSAAIVSYVKSPDALPGLYGIVDIGAWTTDISFFRLNDLSIKETGVPCLSFYAAGVNGIAANAIDNKIIQCLMELWGMESVSQFENNNLSEWIREYREKDKWPKELSYKSKMGNVDNKPIPKLAVEYSKEVISEAVCRFFTQTLRDAYEKEKVPDKWQESLNLFIIGGGSREKCFGGKIKDKHGNNLHKKSLHTISFSNLKDTPASIHYRLGVAAGLSYPVATWPKQIPPSGVSDWSLEKPTKIPDRDELYPK